MMHSSNLVKLLVFLLVTTLLVVPAHAYDLCTYRGKGLEVELRKVIKINKLTKIKEGFVRLDSGVRSWDLPIYGGKEDYTGSLRSEGTLFMSAKTLMSFEVWVLFITRGSKTFWLYSFQGSGACKSADAISNYSEFVAVEIWFKQPGCQMGC
jgi:hypothetical protein